MFENSCPLPSLRIIVNSCTQSGYIRLLGIIFESVDTLCEVFERDAGVMDFSSNRSDNPKMFIGVLGKTPSSHWGREYTFLSPVVNGPAGDTKFTCYFINRVRSDYPCSNTVYAVLFHTSNHKPLLAQPLPVLYPIWNYLTTDLFVLYNAASERKRQVFCFPVAPLRASSSHLLPRQAGFDPPRPVEYLVTKSK